MLPPIGSDVLVRWRPDLRHGGGELHHIGSIIEIDDWIKIGPSGQTGGTLHVPLTYLDSIELHNQAPANPFMLT